jgi:hypothetical protein
MLEFELSERIKLVSEKIIEKMETNLLKKQHRYGITESENLKVVAIRLVYLIELTDEEYLNEPWLVGTEECQIQSENPIISKLKKKSRNPLRLPQTRTQGSRPVSTLTGHQGTFLDVSANYSNFNQPEVSKHDLYQGLAHIGLSYGKIPSRQPIAARP